MKHVQTTSKSPSLSTGRPIHFRGEPCGAIVGDTFERHFNSHLHILRRHGALSFHREVLAQLAGVRWLLAIDETGRQRWARIEELKRNGIPVNDPIYGPQLALPLKAWRSKREDDPRDDQDPGLVQGELL